MRKAPSPSDRALHSSLTIHAFSNNNEVQDEDRFLLFLANNTNPSIHDTKKLRQLRAKITSAKLAADHLINLGLPPILEAKLYLAIKGKK